MNEYDHVQKAPWPVLFSPVLLILLAAVSFAPLPIFPLSVMSVGGALLVLVSLTLSQIRVRDEGDHLSVRFGPLSLFSFRIPYDDIVAVEPDRSSFWEGWGIHRTRRGWLYNVWGYECVRITTTKSTIRVGTDDPLRISEFLRQQIGRRPG